MKTTYIQSTTIHVLPILYFRTNPLTLGMGWLGHGIEFSHKDNSAEMDQRLLDSINKSRESWVAKGWVEQR